MKKKSKVSNFLTGTGNDKVYNPEKIEKSVAVQLSEEIENQYRVFSEDIKSIKEEMSKIHKELLNHVACLQLKIAQFDNQGVSALVNFFKVMVESKIEMWTQRIGALENRTDGYIQTLCFVENDLKKISKTIEELKGE